MNLFKSKHRKLLDEKEKIQELFDKVKAIKPISDIDIAVKDTQVHTLINNWITLARLLDQYQPKFKEDAPETYANMIGGLRRVHVLRKIGPEALEAYLPLGNVEATRPSPVLETFLPWEQVAPNLNPKAQVAISTLVERKKRIQITKYCEHFKDNETIFENFILSDSLDTVNERLDFIHKQFYYLNLGKKTIANKVNVAILLDNFNIPLVDVIVLCNTVATQAYDFLIKE